MTIYLAEAVKLKSIIRKRLMELIEERERVAFSTIEKGQPLPEQVRSLEQVEQEIERVRKDARTLDRLVYRANIDTTLTFENETLPIVEAIEYAIQLRAAAEEAKTFAAADPESLVYGYGDQLPIYRVARFDPETYRKRALLLERRAHVLSNAINATNYQVTVPFDDRFYLGDA